MSLEGTYDDANIFARILRGEVPSARVFEDEHVLAFMDAFPQSHGHTLVIPKHAKARNLLDIEPEPLSWLILGVQRVTRAVVAALNPDGVVVTQFNGAPSGQTIYHLHVHIIPRWTGREMGGHAAGKMADMAELTALAEAISAQIS